MLDPLPDIGLILRNASVRGILWGEQAMLRCGIRTGLFVSSFTLSQFFDDIS
jgi:hypothetical protein